MVVSGLHIRSECLERRLWGAGPEARFLIEAVLRMAVLGNGWNGEKNDLARRLRLTKSFVSVGVDDLVRAGLLERRSAVTERRGRPAITYEVKGEVWNDLKSLESPFSPLFDELFLGAEQAYGVFRKTTEPFWTGRKIDSILRKNPPNACNRLLLAVLLDHANEVGLVVGVSRSDLQRMTGFNAVRVRNRLAVLMECGWVQFHAPGFASARFPGGKVKSSFILNNDLLPCTKKSLIVKVFNVEGDHFSSAAGNLYKQGGFGVSRESMLGVWLLTHRFISIALSRLRSETYLQDKKAVGELIMSTLRADSPNKADGVDFEPLCNDFAEWVVYLANHYIAEGHVDKEWRNECVWVLPYRKTNMLVMCWKTDQLVI